MLGLAERGDRPGQLDPRAGSAAGSSGFPDPGTACRSVIASTASGEPSGSCRTSVAARRPELRPAGTSSVTGTGQGVPSSSMPRSATEAASAASMKPRSGANTPEVSSSRSPAGPRRACTLASPLAPRASPGGSLSSQLGLRGSSGFLITRAHLAGPGRAASAASVTGAAPQGVNWKGFRGRAGCSGTRPIHAALAHGRRPSPPVPPTHGVARTRDEQRSQGHHEPRRTAHHSRRRPANPRRKRVSRAGSETSLARRGSRPRRGRPGRAAGRCGRCWPRR